MILALTVNPHLAPKQKRSRVAEVGHKAVRRRLQSEQVIASLKQLMRDCPRFAGEIDRFIQRVSFQTERTRSSDAQMVLSLLKEWDFGLTVKEIMDDTGLSHWDVRQILAELVKAKKIERKDVLRAGMRSRQWHSVYLLRD